MTEIGVATLDTRDLQGIAPGENGFNWHACIRARHFRIGEYTYLRNHKFIIGCPERFNFGDSEIINKASIPSVIASCFKQPYSAPGVDPSSCELETERRNIVLLGHDVQQDVQYLQKVGYNVTNLSNLIETQDTSVMYRAFTHETNPCALGRVCLLLEITAFNLHNAGNDAAFTLQAMLGLCVKDAVEHRGQALEEKSRERGVVLEEKIQRAKEDAEVKLREEAETWNLASGDVDDDGGVPLNSGRVIKNVDKGLVESVAGLKIESESTDQWGGYEM